jgi:hypothetical protein
MSTFDSTPPTIPFMISAREIRILLRSLSRLRKGAAYKISHNKRVGWKPEPGKGDINEMILAHANDLNRRLSALADTHPVEDDT